MVLPLINLASKAAENFGDVGTKRENMSELSELG